MRRSDGASNIPLYTITYIYYFFKKIKNSKMVLYKEPHAVSDCLFL